MSIFFKASFYSVLENVVTKKNIMSKLVLGAITAEDTIEEAALDRHIRVRSLFQIVKY